MVQRRIHTSTEKSEVEKILEGLGFTEKLPYNERMLPDAPHIKVSACSPNELVHSNRAYCEKIGAKTEILYIDYRQVGKTKLDMHEAPGFSRRGRKLYETLLGKLENPKVTYFGKRLSWEKF